MSKRKPLSSKGSKRLFTTTAKKVHVKNAPAPLTLRGGIRM